MIVKALKPFWRYYGGKFRAAPRYPAPHYSTIVEPFAGAAGYSLRYPDRDVILADVYPVVAGIWRYLIATPRAEIEHIPLVEAVDDLPSWVPQEARWLVGFSLNAGTVSPCRTLSSGRKKLRAMGRKFEGWSEQMRARVASQVDSIRHWRIVEASYETLNNEPATWFVDPPYDNRAGRYYKHHTLDYQRLGSWCRDRKGQVIVCENVGATWLPFEPFYQTKAFRKGTSAEAIWLANNHPDL